MSNTLYLLDQPLVNEAILGLEDVVDVYVSDSMQPDRWRTYIDYKNWDPKEFNDQLVQKKMYHARIFIETTVLLSITPVDWLISEQIKSIQELSAIHLRKYEFDLVGFQLLTGNVTINIRKDQRQQLMITGTILYSTIFWWLNQITSTNKMVKQSKQVLSQWRPMSVDSTRSCAKYIDNMVETIRILLKLELSDEDYIDGKKFKQELGLKLRNCIIGLDKVLIVVS